MISGDRSTHSTNEPSTLWEAGPDAAAEWIPAFLEEWADRLDALQRAAVLVPLWRWWLRQRLAQLAGVQDPEADATAINSGCATWAQARWEPGLEREFLARQERYHLMRYSQLRVANKDLANELAFQLREREADFPELNFRYGQLPERKRGGLMPALPLSSIPSGVAKILQRLQPGQVAGPIRVGEEFLLLRLEASTTAILDAPMRERLLADLLEEWCAQGDAALLAALDSVASAATTQPG